MTYRKEEYTVNGIEVTIQQVNGPEAKMGASEPSVWFNGGAAYVSNALEAGVIPVDVSRDTQFETFKSAVTYMVDNELRFCPKCKTFRDVDSFVTTGFAGRKCTDCDKTDKTCQDGDSHNDKCLNPSQKHNARVATKYKCQKCGRVRKTTPTG